MKSSKRKSKKDVPLSESTISPSLSAIRERCQDLFDTNGFIKFDIVDAVNDAESLPAGAYNPYNHKK